MPILNYTTKISAFKTIGEIQELLAKHGASGIQIDYNNSQPVGLTFDILVQARPVVFRLPARHDGVLKAMKKDTKIPRSLCTPDQALRVSWRIIKDWTEAQLAIIDAELASLAEVFLPYVVTNDGHTLYERFESHGLSMLPSPSAD